MSTFESYINFFWVIFTESSFPLELYIFIYSFVSTMSKSLLCLTALVQLQTMTSNVQYSNTLDFMIFNTLFIDFKFKIAFILIAYSASIHFLHLLVAFPPIDSLLKETCYIYYLHTNNYLLFFSFEYQILSNQRAICFIRI